MSDLRLVFEPPLGRIVLDRPERRNAMSAQMWASLEVCCAELVARTDIDAVILEGTGGHLCAGADISEFDEVFADLSHAKRYLGAIERALDALSGLALPTIAKLEGFTVGGGFALALACDLRFASDNAVIAVPPAKLGLLYGPVETRLLVEAVGPAVAKDLLFTARNVAPEEALRLGLVSRIFPAAELARSVDEQARALSELSQGSLRGAKKAVRATLDRDATELRSLVETAALSADFREGRAAYTAKRKPAFARER